MWTLFERGELTAESTLSGAFVRDETPADAHAVLLAVEDAREEALQRELGRESSSAGQRSPFPNRAEIGDRVTSFLRINGSPSSSHGNSRTRDDIAPREFRKLREPVSS
jgi:hypothetical protein